MPLKTDFVMRGCVISTAGCNLSNKCEECKKEIETLIKIDSMFLDVFKNIKIR